MVVFSDDCVNIVIGGWRGGVGLALLLLLPDYTLCSTHPYITEDQISNKSPCLL